MFKTIKENMANIAFGAFYFGLFFLQMLPHLAVMFVEPMTVAYILMWTVGVDALVTRAIKFPCFTVRILNTAMVGLTISAFFMKGMF